MIAGFAQFFDLLVQVRTPAEGTGHPAGYAGGACLCQNPRQGLP